MGFADHPEYQIGFGGIYAWLAPGQDEHARGDPEGGRFGTAHAGDGGNQHFAGRDRTDHPGSFGGDELADALDSGDIGRDAAGIDRFACERARAAEDLGQPDPVRDGGGGGVRAVGSGSFLGIAGIYHPIVTPRATIHQ